MNESEVLLSRSVFRVSISRARAAWTFGGALALLATPPALGQANRPVVTHSHPLVRLDKRHTRVSFEFNLPRGFTLADRPWIRIVHPDGKPFLGMRPLFSQRAPTWKGEHDLNTEDYPAGAYRLRVEVEIVNPQGRREIVASNWAPFVVPRRAGSGGN
jgi:hypothetical protein